MSKTLADYWEEALEVTLRAPGGEKADIDTLTILQLAFYRGAFSALDCLDHKVRDEPDDPDGLDPDERWQEELDKLKDDVGMTITRVGRAVHARRDRSE